MSLAIQILVTGLAAGGVYGLLAIGHSLVFRLTGIVHFALGLVVCLAAGAGSYMFAIQPYLARGSTIGWVAATVAIAFAIRAVLSAIFERPSHVFPDPLPFRDVGKAGVVSIGGASVQVRSFFVIAVAVALAALATLLLNRTRSGRALQAIASEPEGARVVGIPVERLVVGAFALAGGLAAIAAVAAAPSAPFDVDSGTLLGLKGLVAALFVRFGSPWNAFAAGIGLGVAEAAISSANISGFELGPQYREVIPLAAALLFVALRPPHAVGDEVE